MNTIETENSTLTETVEKVTPIKEWLVEYVGEKLAPEDNQVTVEMVIKVVAKEFPEFLLPVAEENFIRGYQQAILDVEESDKYISEALNTSPPETNE